MTRRTDTADDTDSPVETLSPELAAPGPHPLESDDIRFWRGDEDELPKGVKATAGKKAGEATPDPLACQPGPHPHESADIVDWGGRSTNLPKGVEPFEG